MASKAEGLFAQHQGQVLNQPIPSPLPSHACGWLLKNGPAPLLCLALAVLRALQMAADSKRLEVLAQLDAQREELQVWGGMCGVLVGCGRRAKEQGREQQGSTRMSVVQVGSRARDQAWPRLKLL